ncbi:hypothetical protein HBH98_167290 [Parastagonospora nodorum]|nr:hypothetical protein HBH53_160460 [Parastagonospora nodorum]KAH3960785.1 hypothetical protein HBH51_188750 [Parastagonospora nodorum]KAH3962888.1 hypothetical protein HBH52_221420 [Parastagonospora nodorum]KAH4022546.1 hypothetical protein HBI09_171030 [Parastagonospora nodorum]KAH4052310.1 hypothetical protein HBH49_099600 [Parastagonospora nodorum]
MHVAVLGASGIQGLHQLHHLAHNAHTVTAISRTPPALQPSLSHRIQHVAADFSSLPALAHAFKSVDTLFVNLPSTSFNPSAAIIAGARNVAVAAQKAGVRLMVFNASMPIPLTPQGITAQDDRRAIRANLRDSGVPVISVEPVVYLDNLLEGWAVRPIREEGRVVYCHKPDLRVSWVCHHDVAQIMLAAAQRPEMAGRDIRVGGPETVVLSELTAKLSRAWGRELACENQSVADFCQRISESMKGRGLEGEKIVAQMFKAYTYYNEAEDEPFRVDMSEVVEELGVRLTTIEEWAGRRSPWDDKGYF